MAIHFFSLKTTSCGRVTKSNVSKSLGQHKAWEYVHNIHMILMFSHVFQCFPMFSHVNLPCFTFWLCQNSYWKWPFSSWIYPLIAWWFSIVMWQLTRGVAHVLLIKSLSERPVVLYIWTLSTMLDPRREVTPASQEPSLFRKEGRPNDETGGWTNFSRWKMT